MASLVAHMVKKKSTLNVGDPGQPLGREVPLEIGKGNGYPLQYSCLENTMYRSYRFLAILYNCDS